MKSLVHLLLLLLAGVSVFGQYPNVNEWPGLPDPDSNNGLTNYTALDEVFLNSNPEFHLLPSNSNSFHVFIDESVVSQNINYQEMYDDGSFNSAINTSKSVGNTSGTFSPTPSGGAGYSVPISLPPGTNEMVPSLSVNYNSQGGNGLLGVGWNLSVGSSISRTGRSIYHNGYVKGVQLNNTDLLSMDGSRLMVVNGGNYGAVNSIYGTESESFNKIIPHGALDDPNCWFEVQSKDGTTIEYGRTDDSKLFVNGIIVAWNISKVSDQFTNYYCYHYITEDHELRLDKVLYTGNTDMNVEPYNEIKFHYTERDDKSVSYIQGYPSKRNILLDYIRISAEGSLFKKYKFDYGYEGYSYLKNIHDIGSDGNSRLNPISFQYEELLNDQVDDIDLDYDRLNRYVPADFNGDGRTDFLEIFKNPLVETEWSNVEITNNYTVFQSQVHYNEQDGGYDTDLLWSGEFQDYNDNYNVYSLPEYSNIHIPTDFNGDGHTDLAVFNLSLGGSQLNFFKIKFSANIPSESLNYFADVLGQTSLTAQHDVFDIEYEELQNGESEETEVQLSGVPRHTNSGLNFVYPGDFNGDGSTDLITCLRYKNQYGNQIKKNRYKLSCFYPVTGVQKAILGLNIPDHQGIDAIRVIDYDGDGKQELMVTKKNAWDDIESITTIYEITDNGGSTLQLNVLDQRGFPTENHDVHLGDFNGDGKTDLFAKQHGQGYNDWNIYYGTGATDDSGSFDISTTLTPYAFGIPPDIGDVGVSLFRSIKIADLNADGKSDIFSQERITRNNLQDIRFTVHYYNGNEFVSDVLLDQFSVPQDAEHWIFRNFSDINGDGKLEFDFGHVSIGPAEDRLKAHYFKPAFALRKLSAVKNGFGGITTAKYTSIAENDWIYKADDQDLSMLDAIPMTTDMIGVEPPISVLSEYTSLDARGIMTNTTTLRYESAIAHKTGKGFLGFKKVISENLLNSSKTVTTYEISSAYLNVNLANQQTFLSTDPNDTVDDILLSETINTFEMVPVGNSDGYLTTRFQGKLTNSLNRDLLNLRSTNTSRAIDSHGNLLSSTIGIYSGTNQDHLIEESISTSNYISLGSWWIPSRTTSESITTTRTGEQPYTRSDNFVYNIKGVPESHTKDIGLLTQFTYDGFGNILEKINSSSDVESQNRTTSSEYDSKGRYALKVKNSLGQEIENKYDPRWGKVISVIDVAGQEALYSYDAFGRLTGSVSPKGIQSSRTFNWISDDPSAANDSYTEANDVIYQVINTNEGGANSAEWFNRSGLLRKSMTQGEFNDVFSVTTYNPKGEVTKETLPFFQGAIDSEIGISNFEYDVHGRIKKTSITGIPGFSVYNYSNVLNNGMQASKVEINDVQGHLTSKVVDAAGKVIKSVDSGGELSFKHSSNGSQRETRLNDDIISSITFDEFGRKISLFEVNSGTTTYDYSQFGELLEQTDANGNKSSYTYDIMGKVLSESITNGAQELGSYTYEYVAEGSGLNSIKKRTSPNGFTKEFVYNQDGLVAQINEIIDGEIFITHFTYDEFGNVIEEISPDDLIVRYEYNLIGQLNKVLDENDNIIWQGIERNAFGQYTHVHRGNGKESVYSYNKYAMPKHYFTEGIQDLEFEFEANSGNLLSRKDMLKDRMESFSYDNLNRLTNFVVSEIETNIESSALSLTFSSNGNIQNKSDVGNYNYDQIKVNAITQISDPMTDQFASQNIQYNHFNSTSLISEGTSLLSLSYGTDKQRSVSDYFVDDVLVERKFYSGNHERLTKNGVTTEINYISSGMGLCAIHVRDDLNNTEGKWYYNYSDYQGSILALTDDQGNFEIEQNFDPWGRKRNASTWDYDNSLGDHAWFTRGYTGHEIYDQFDLINMNGRIYDPVVGRMLSPDNNLQDPFNSQNYNRYSYVLNNPLKYTDPDGEFIVGMLVGAAISVALNGITNYSNNESFFSGAMQAAVFGIMTGVLSFGIGEVAQGFASAGKFAVKTFAHSYTNGIISAASGGDFLSGFVSGGVSTIVSAKSLSFLDKISNNPSVLSIGTVTSSFLSGGLSSGAVGGNFMDGAKYGATSAIMNEIVHYGPGLFKKAPRYGDREGFNEFLEKAHGDKTYPDNIKFWMEAGPGWIANEFTGQFESTTRNPDGTAQYHATATTNVHGRAIYLSKWTFKSWNRLYISTGHEILHAIFIQRNMRNGAFEHRSINEWAFNQAVAFGMDDTKYWANYDRIQQMIPEIPPGYEYTQFGF